MEKRMGKSLEVENISCLGVDSSQAGYEAIIDIKFKLGVLGKLDGDQRHPAVHKSG